MSGEETCDIVIRQQTSLVDYFRETVHTMDEAIKVGRVLVAAGNRFHIAIGLLANHVEKGKAGRGFKGGIREFSHGIGILSALDASPCCECLLHVRVERIALRRWEESRGQKQGMNTDDRRERRRN